jgi:UDP-N-acetylglucosamine 2-epimerase (non-hydrolysing)
MSGRIFEDLRLRDPDLNLGIGSGSHAEQTAGVLVAYERYLIETEPDAIAVVGDVNSTFAATLAASKLGIPVAHVEAGLRSGDWSMPEEVNRVITDRLSAWLFTPSEDAGANVASEGLSKDRVHLVGNVMIDSLLDLLPLARSGFDAVQQRLQLPDRFAVLTLHRPSNVDGEKLKSLALTFNEIGREVPLVFPVHPRTAERLEILGLRFGESVKAIDPLGYRDFLGLIDASTLVLTDSGGIQEETSVLGVPCITLRDTTERPITCELGTNKLVGTDHDAIISAVAVALGKTWTPAEIPLWDGRTAPRIADIIVRDLT